ncbi:AEC family transporter [Alteromonas sp. ASW11-19]|uniref:AEC family transporter n=1 Tax=Alteromonas salexigens TaxID=2982530 RepID=A0ABT2VLA6_9ALTE|nr:AEC family transporter [Alteromonas salexigens]MCU7553046.1 AEC family transporter [Alteromonas salexigens]
MTLASRMLNVSLLHRAHMDTATFTFALNVTGPVLGLLAIGLILYRRRMLTDSFVVGASKLVFNLALPVLLFLAISEADFSEAANPTLIGTAIIATLVFFLFLMGLCHLTVSPRSARGVVVQGGFRANMGIIGLAYCDNLYGTHGIAVASVFLGCITMVYNVLSVFVLNYYLPARRSFVQHVQGMFTNPLIIAIVLALPFSYWQITLPEVITQTGSYLAQLTLPLALLCTGASLQFRGIGRDMAGLAVSMLSKCLLYPLALTLAGYWAGLRGMPLGVLYLMTMAPTAAASYVMARGLGGDPRLAANIIALTTVVSLPTTVAGFALLNYWQLL